MTTPKPLRGVVFDLDGTLYDKRPLEWYMVRKLAASLPRLWRYTKVRSSLAGIDLGDGPALARETLTRLTRDAAAQTRWHAWIQDRYEPTLLAGLRATARPYPGTAELLRRLAGSGVRVGLVSDYRGVHDRLDALGLDPNDFHFILVTEDLGAMKPAPRVAALTLTGMGLGADEMVMVGDRAFADQRFAAAAGMAFLGVRPRGPADGPWAPWPVVAARLAALAS